MSPDFDDDDRVTVGAPSLGGPRPPASTYLLVVIYPRDPMWLGKRIQLGDTPVRVGRGSHNNVVLDGDAVSRRHAHFEQRSNEWIIVDDGSTNGTFVNDVQISHEKVLSNGDRLKIGRTIFKFLSGADVEAHYHEELYRMTIVDGLTGIHNERYFSQALERDIVRARRHKSNLAVLLFDIDQLKRINEAHASITGDFVLSDIARIVRGMMGADMVFARCGGDEFGIILPGMSIEESTALAEALRQKVAEQLFVFRTESIRVTISVGTAQLQDVDRWPIDLMKRVEHAVYVAKRLGRNRTVASSLTDYRRLLDAPLLLETALAQEPPGLLVAFELDDEVAIIERLGSGVYEEWLRDLIRDVELSLREEDLLGTWRDRFVLASLRGGSVEAAAALVDRVRVASTARPAVADHQEIPRQIRSAYLDPVELISHGERSLDVLIAGLRQRASTAPGQEDDLPFPIAALRAMVAGQRTTLGRVNSLLYGIETALRFMVAVELGVVQDRMDPTLDGRAASVIAGSEKLGEAWGNVALDLAALIPHHPGNAISEAAQAFSQAMANRAPLATELGWAADVRRSMGLQTGLSEDAHGAKEHRLRGIFDSILSALHPLGKLRLVSVAQIEDVHEEPLFRYGLYLHRGSGEHFPIIQEELRFRLQKGWCYLLAGGRERAPVCLAPVLLSRICDTCGRVEVAVTEQLTTGPKGARITVHGVTSNHKGTISVPWLLRLQAIHEAVLTAGDEWKRVQTDVTRVQFVSQVLLADGGSRIAPARSSAPPRDAPLDSSGPAVRRRLRLFCSYAAEDEQLLSRLDIHLRPLKQDGLVEVWHEHRLLAGQPVAEEIAGHIEQADLVLLLVSADFLASESCRELVRRALDRQAASQTVVVPVLVRPCTFSAEPFAKLRTLPKNGIHVTGHVDQEQAWAEVAGEIRNLIATRL